MLLMRYYKEEKISTITTAAHQGGENSDSRFHYLYVLNIIIDIISTRITYIDL